MKGIAAGATIGVASTNLLTQDGVITALNLEDTVLLGLTFGAWFKIGMTIALILLIVERGVGIYSTLSKKKE